MMKREKLARVGVIGDIHAEDAALRAALDSFATLGVDAVLAVGDVVDGRGDPNRCCELLENHEVIAVSGNHERWMFAEEMRDLPDAHRLLELNDESARYLRQLPGCQDLVTVAGELLLCHGLGANDMASLKPDHLEYDIENNRELQALLAENRYSFVVAGHTHRRMVRRVGTITFLNPGTLHFADDPGFLLVDFELELAQFFDFASDGSIVEAEARKLAEWTELF